MGGGEKPLLEFEGRSILERQLEVLSPLFDEIAICSDRPEPYAGSGLPVLRDRVSGAGPLAGIAAALAWSRRERVFAVAGDMPLLDRRVIELLLASAPDADLVAPVVSGRPEPLHALYGRRCLAAIDARLAAGRRKAAELITDTDDTGLTVAVLDEERIRRSIPELDSDLRFLTNVNAPEDLP